MFSELPFDSTSEFKQFLPIGYREYTYHSSLKRKKTSVHQWTKSVHQWTKSALKDWEMFYSSKDVLMVDIYIQPDDANDDCYN